MKLTFPQHCALVDLSERPSSTAAGVQSSIATLRGLVKRDLAIEDGSTRKGKPVFRITEAGRNALKNKEGR